MSNATYRSRIDTYDFLPLPGPAMVALHLKDGDFVTIEVIDNVMLITKEVESDENNPVNRSLARINRRPGKR